VIAIMTADRIAITVVIANSGLHYAVKRGGTPPLFHVGVTA
jgi:hypothetical protein